MSEEEKKALVGMGMFLGALFTVGTLIKAATASQAAKNDGS